VVLLIVALALGLADARAWNWSIWPAVERQFASHWVVFTSMVAAIAGAALIAHGTVSRSRRGSARPSGLRDDQARDLGPLTSYRSVAAIFIIVAGAGLGAMTLMLLLAAQAGDYQGAGNTTQLRVEAIKYGLGSIAAAGGAVGILLAVRRQRLAENSHQLAERAQSHTETDAARRRVTELFTKAVEMLGHSDAAVRLGALHALERVAGDDHHQQQTVANILCAYLRMPYKLPADFAPVGGTDVMDRLGLTADGPDHVAAVRDPRQELQVRMAAQQILAAHLSTSPERGSTQQPVWENVNLDLSRAVLVNWSLQGGRLLGGNFTGTLFVGDTQFTGTTVEGKSWFGRAIFTYSARFLGARFHGLPSFEGTIFGGDATFDECTFRDGARFKGATFDGVAGLAAEFPAGATFDEVTFVGDVTFVGVGPGDSMTFDATTVRLGRDRADIWPPGWQVEPEPSDRTTGRLVPDPAHRPGDRLRRDGSEAVAGQRQRLAAPRVDHGAADAG
jgi:hypothetical protein